MPVLISTVAALAAGCAGSPGPSLEARRQAAEPAVAALQRGAFERAEELAKEPSARDSGDPYSHLVRALTRYKKSMHQLALDGRTAVLGGLESGSFNQKYLKSTLADAESDLAAVEEDLAVVAREPAFAVELCVACWEIDWNGNGRIDDRDLRLFEIEQDERGEEIPEGDPRRRPTFRFDHGDVAWARAFVSFQRAAVDVLLAYDWTEVAGLAMGRRERPDRIVIRLVDEGRIADARRRFLDGLVFSDASRRDYLAETDDDREWMPSPKQVNHPMPLPVDAALYATWEGVVGDLRRLAEGEEGLFVADLFTLADEEPETRPTGYLDVGHMLAHPKDIVLELDTLERLERAHDVEGLLRATLGDHYVPEMKPSPLPRRLLRMKGELDQQEGELERKLRYLFWIN